jgi:hypothetical protein
MSYTHIAGWTSPRAIVSHELTTDKVSPSINFLKVRASIIGMLRPCKNADALSMDHVDKFEPLYFCQAQCLASLAVPGFACCAWLCLLCLPKDLRAPLSSWWQTTSNFLLVLCMYSPIPRLHVSQYQVYHLPLVIWRAGPQRASACLSIAAFHAPASACAGSRTRSAVG